MKSKRKDTLIKVLKLIGGYKGLLLLSILLAGAASVLQIYAPVIFGDAIDRIIGTGNVDISYVLSCLIRILLVILLAAAASFGMNLVNNRLAYGVVKDIRSQAMNHIQTLPLSYLDSHSTGDIVSRVISDADILTDGLLLGFTQLFSGIVTIAVTLVFMMMKSVGITLMVLALTPVSFFIARFISSHSFRMFKNQSKSRGDQTALIEEMIGHQKVVRAFGYEKESSERFRKINEELRNYSREAMFFSSLTNPSTRFVNGVVYALVALVGAFQVMGGPLTVGGITVLLSYANQYMKPFNDISDVISELQNALACAGRLFELTEAPSEAPAPKAALKNVRGGVNIDHVYFSYEPEQKLIENFTLHTNPGTRVALVGPTGCGKTTFINLLMRFYDPVSGSISVDGQDVQSVSRESLRRSWGMVLQDSWLKTATVRDNINIGKPDATDEEIISAAKKAHSWSFIRRLPQGLDTVLDDESLSQGQKQLLCITRVMLALPPMLILDEATSSIDTRTELQIQQAFDAMMEGRTSFVVAHRLSTIRNADVILVMKDGHIIEQGSHEKLMARGGFYSTLYNSQFVNLTA